MFPYASTSVTVTLKGVPAVWLPVTVTVNPTAPVGATVNELDAIELIDPSWAVTVYVPAVVVERVRVALPPDRATGPRPVNVPEDGVSVMASDALEAALP